MHLVINRNILNNKFETVVSFQGFGNNDMTPEEEKELLENFPIEISYADIAFSGKFDVVSGEVVASEALDAEEVGFVIAQRTIKINELFVAKYEVSTSQIQDTELGTKLSTKELVCQAKAKLFELKVIAEVKRLVDELKLKSTNFEAETPIMVTI